MGKQFISAASDVEDYDFNWKINKISIKNFNMANVVHLGINLVKEETYIFPVSRLGRLSKFWWYHTLKLRTFSRQNIHHKWFCDILQLCPNNKRWCHIGSFKMRYSNKYPIYTPYIQQSTECLPIKLNLYFTARLNSISRKKEKIYW